MVGVLEEVVRQWWPCSKTCKSLIIGSKYTEHSQHVKSSKSPLLKTLAAPPSSMYYIPPTTPSLYGFLWELGICVELRSLDTAVDFNCGPVQPLYHKCFVISSCVAKTFCRQPLCLQGKCMMQLPSCFFSWAPNALKDFQAFLAPLWPVYWYRQIWVALCSRTGACFYTWQTDGWKLWAAEHLG